MLRLGLVDYREAWDRQREIHAGGDTRGREHVPHARGSLEVGPAAGSGWQVEARFPVPARNDQ